MLINFYCFRYYEATIESIDGEEVSVVFDSNRSAQVTTLEFIRELPHNQEKSLLKYVCFTLFNLILC